MADLSAATVPPRLPGQGVADDRYSLRAVATGATIVAQLLDAVPDGLLLLDPDGRLILVNSRIEEMFGFTRGDLLGQPVEMLVPESLRGSHEAHRRDFAARPRLRPMGAAMTLYGRRHDGSEFPVDISLSPVLTDDGQWTVAAVRDATHRHAAEALRHAAVVDEQTRIAGELADSVIRGLFGAGLELQGVIEAADGRVQDRLWGVVERIDATIRELRSVIFGRSHDAPASVDDTPSGDAR